MSDDDITRLLKESVSDVEPRRGSAEFYAAIDDTGTGRTRWVRGALAAAVAVVAVVAGTAYLHSRNGNGAAPAGPTRDVEATVYFVGTTAAGPRLFSEGHNLTTNLRSDAQVALDAALGLPDDPDYHSGFATGTTATVTVNATGDVVIDFDKTPVLADHSDATSALQSLVWTVDSALHTSAPVRFTVEGQTPSTLLGARAATSYQKASADSVLSPASLDLAEGAQVTSASTISGMASAFEANVVWSLKQGDTVVRHGYTTAATCCTLSPFTFTLEAPPGAYTLTVSDTDPSGGEGHGVTTDSKDIEIQ